MNNWILDNWIGLAIIAIIVIGILVVWYNTPKKVKSRRIMTRINHIEELKRQKLNPVNRYVNGKIEGFKDLTRGKITRRAITSGLSLIPGFGLLGDTIDAAEIGMEISEIMSMLAEYSEVLAAVDSYGIDSLLAMDISELSDLDDSLAEVERNLESL